MFSSLGGREAGLNSIAGIFRFKHIAGGGFSALCHYQQLVNILICNIIMQNHYLHNHNFYFMTKRKSHNITPIRHHRGWGSTPQVTECCST